MLKTLSVAKLVLLYNAVAEQPVKRFENTAKALRRTREAIKISGYATHDALVKAGLLPDDALPSPLTPAETPAATDVLGNEPAAPVVTAAQLVEKIGMTKELAELVETFVTLQQLKRARPTRSPARRSRLRVKAR